MSYLIMVLAIIGMISGLIFWIEDRSTVMAEAVRKADAARETKATYEKLTDVHGTVQADLTSTKAKLRKAETANRALQDRVTKAGAAGDYCPPGGVISIPVEK